MKISNLNFLRFLKKIKNLSSKTIISQILFVLQKVRIPHFKALDQLFRPLYFGYRIENFKVAKQQKFLIFEGSDLTWITLLNAAS